MFFFLVKSKDLILVAHRNCYKKQKRQQRNARLGCCAVLAIYDKLFEYGLSDRDVTMRTVNLGFKVIFQSLSNREASTRGEQTSPITFIRFFFGVFLNDQFLRFCLRSECGHCATNHFSQISETCHFHFPAHGHLLSPHDGPCSSRLDETLPAHSSESMCPAVLTFDLL